jgi:hypothetical protein
MLVRTRASNRSIRFASAACDATHSARLLHAMTLNTRILLAGTATAATAARVAGPKADLRRRDVNLAPNRRLPGEGQY